MRRARTLLLSAALVLSACGGGVTGPGRTVPPTTGATLSAATARQAVAALCRIAEGLPRGRAEAAFYDRAHATLHLIAATVQPVDPAAAGRLLEAKYRVEADLRAGGGGLTVHARLLAEATRQALDVLGLRVPGCG